MRIYLAAALPTGHGEPVSAQSHDYGEYLFAGCAEVECSGDKPICQRRNQERIDQDDAGWPFQEPLEFIDTGSGSMDESGDTEHTSCNGSRYEIEAPLGAGVGIKGGCKSAKRDQCGDEHGNLHPSTLPRNRCRFLHHRPLDPV